jgi:hypothetical protein
VQRAELLVQRAELLMTTPGGGRARAALRDQRGTAFLMGLMLVMVMTLLGVALFEMSTIEAGLARSDALEIQAFYCAEAEAARVYALYAPANDPEAPANDAKLGSQRFGDTSLTLANGQYFSSALAEVVNDVVRVTATCRLPNGRTRTVQRNGKREYPNPLFNYAEAGAGGDPQSVFGDMVLGTDSMGRADWINGNIYVSGNVYLRGEGKVGFDPPILPAITVAPGKAVTSTSSRFDAAGAGMVAQGQVTPLPVLSNPPPADPGIIDQIRLAVTSDGAPKMKGRYQGATVYNLTEIFAQLGATNEGNRERNLARPGNCTFGVASSDVKCQIWQDLVILGPRQTCVSGNCGPGSAEKPSYFFMGLPRSPSVVPQGTPFSDIYAAAVTFSPELRQLGFTPQYGSLGSRLDAILGANPNGEGRVDRLVDLTVGIDETGKGIERPPSIFYVDGYWRTDGSASGFAYNGRGTIVASKSVILSDSLLYLGDMSNVNPVAPEAGCANPSDRGRCGAADMLGIMAQENIWVGDPDGQIHQVDALMLAGNDVNLVQYAASAATCCDGVNNPLTFNGTVLGLRGTALARDWADPTPGRQEADCNAAQPPCRPVTFVQTDTSCGGAGCWRFLSKDPVTGLFVVDTELSGFQEGCVTTQAQPLMPWRCPPGSRRVTHFQLSINYDKRLQEHPELIPPGLPTGGQTGYWRLAARLWKDCGSNPACP